jgi:hypothetical protein
MEMIHIVVVLGKHYSQVLHRVIVDLRSHICEDICILPQKLQKTPVFRIFIFIFTNTFK